MAGITAAKSGLAPSVATLDSDASGIAPPRRITAPQYTAFEQQGTVRPRNALGSYLAINLRVSVSRLPSGEAGLK